MSFKFSIIHSRECRENIWTVKKQVFSFFSRKNFLNVYGGEEILQPARDMFLTCRFQYKCTEKYVDLSESQCDKFLTITQTIFVYYLIFII